MNLKSKNFYKSVLPAICGLVVSGLYVVVDGIFVGQGVGMDGLAAVNIALPLVLLIISITMMLAMGGGTLTSIFLGEGNKEKSNNVFLITLTASTVFSLIITGVGLLFPESLAKLLGSSYSLLAQSTDYIFYYVMFSLFSSTSIVLSIFVKNDGNPNLAMYGMIVGAVTNVFLDWLFIFPLGMGIAGAAIASGLGQITSCLVLSLHFIRKKGDLQIGMPKRDKGMLRNIMKVGAPEFVTQMSQPICVLLFNIIVLRIFGDIGVSAFSVVSYVLTISLSVFVGLAQGLQPLLSRGLGEGKHEDIAYYLKKGLKLNLVMAIAIYVALAFLGEHVIRIFNSDPQLMEIAISMLIVYGLSFIFASVNIVLATYFLSIKKTKQSMVIAVLRSFILNSILICVTPLLLGESFAFAGIVIAEALVMLVAIVLIIKEKAAMRSATDTNIKSGALSAIK